VARPLVSPLIAYRQTLTARVRLRETVENPSKVFISTCTENLPPCDLRQLVLPHSFCEYFPQSRQARRSSCKTSDSGVPARRPAALYEEVFVRSQDPLVIADRDDRNRYHSFNPCEKRGTFQRF
jgi:hypothetical protein